MPFEDRDRVINEFRRGETKILISTDVLARGFDVSQVRPGARIHTQAMTLMGHPPHTTTRTSNAGRLFCLLHQRRQHASAACMLACGCKRPIFDVGRCSRQIWTGDEREGV